MVKYIVIMVLGSSFLWASTDGGQTDIVQRTINFVIFFALMWYLIADKVKAYFVGRTKSIEFELDKVQNRLKEAKDAKINAEKKVEDATRLAAEILALSKKEGVVLNEKIHIQMESDLKAISQQHEALMMFEQRQTVSKVVEEIMTDVLSDANMPLDNEMITQIMLKKVA